MEMTLPHTLSLEITKNYSSSVQKITLLCTWPTSHTKWASVRPQNGDEGELAVAHQSWQRPPGQRSLTRHRTCEVCPLDGRRAGLLRVLLGTEFDTSRQTNGAGRRYILPSSVAEYWRRARIFESCRFFFYRCRILLFSHLQNV